MTSLVNLPLPTYPIQEAMLDREPVTRKLQISMLIQFSGRFPSREQGFFRCYPDYDAAGVPGTAPVTPGEQVQSMMKFPDPKSKF